jgi:hypothetical protein
MRIFVSIAAAGALVAACATAEGHARHVKHPRARTAIAPYHGPHVERPPGYSLGGPNFTACDRINHDRMLVGTCR